MIPEGRLGCGWRGFGLCAYKKRLQNQRAQIGAKISSIINGIESNGIKGQLSLDIFMRAERGLNGEWCVLSQK